jgi:hypothetical protein
MHLQANSYAGQMRLQAHCDHIIIHLLTLTCICRDGVGRRRSQPLTDAGDRGWSLRAPSRARGSRHSPVAYCARCIRRHLTCCSSNMSTLPVGVENSSPSLAHCWREEFGSLPGSSFADPHTHPSLLPQPSQVYNPLQGVTPRLSLDNHGRHPL